MSNELDLVVVTGMSGAGRSTAARALEDHGYFVVDNLPPALLPDLIKTTTGADDVPRLAVVVDARGGRFFDSLGEQLRWLEAENLRPRILFLEASEDVLVRRFEASRRPHPLQGVGRLLDGIRREREAVSELRASADLVVDTSRLNVHELARAVGEAFGDDDQVKLRVTVMSFGFKYGLPVDADMVVDVRFLPNPFWIPELREHTGLDEDVNDYVVAQVGAKQFLDQVASLLDLVAEGYLREGKRYVTVGVGCTGGKHRSVAMSEHLTARLVRTGVEAITYHRDMGRE